MLRRPIGMAFLDVGGMLVIITALQPPYAVAAAALQFLDASSTYLIIKQDSKCSIKNS